LKWELWHRGDFLGKGDSLAFVRRKREHGVVASGDYTARKLHVFDRVKAILKGPPAAPQTTNETAASEIDVNTETTKVDCLAAAARTDESDDDDEI
jgi:hypothetical protein